MPTQEPAGRWDQFTEAGNRVLDSTIETALVATPFYMSALALREGMPQIGYGLLILGGVAFADYFRKSITPKPPTY